MEDLKNRFMNLKELDKYQRVSVEHPVAWYIGLDTSSRFSLFAITEKQPRDMNSTKLVSVFVGARKDGKHGITFSLLDKGNLDIFIHFCKDIIEYSLKAKNPDQVADVICVRYKQWQKAFSKTEGKLLSYEQIKGLIGELLFLKMKMIPQYGVEKAIESWSGIESTDQDFVCDDIWFEVKTTVSGSPVVKISSVEQLDVSSDGYLIVVVLDKTSEADSSRVTLNSIVDLVVESLPSQYDQEKLLDRLLTFGYYFDEAYDRIGFKCNGMRKYRVDSGFPCLRSSLVPSSVQGIKYDLSLSAIESFREE